MNLKSGYIARIAIMLTLLSNASSCRQRSNPKKSAAVPKDEQVMTSEDEYNLGRKIAADVLGKYPPIKSNFNRYASVLAGYLAGFSIRPSTFKGYRVQLIDCPELAAISTPGGFIFLSKPLLSSLNSEDELAGVIAHEVAHIALRHGEMALRRSRSAKRNQQDNEKMMDGLIDLADKAATKSGGDNDDKVLEQTKGLRKEYGREIGDLMYVMQVASYNSEQEYAADKMALNILLGAGYNPQKYSDFLSRTLSTADRLENSGKSPIRMFETHPMDEKRSGRINSTIRGWKPGPISNQRQKRFLQFKAQGLKS